jgi:uncharacterized protein involved in type VI secretion and phage assembly
LPVTCSLAAVPTGEHYCYALPYREAGDDASPEPETESGAFYARLHHERELNRSARIHLFSNAAHLAPGQVLEPQGGVITALKEGVLLTLVTYRGARDSRLHVSVWGMPYTERYCFRPAEIPRPEIHGTLPARIESREKNDIYAHLDEQGRYRVKLDFDREGTEPGYGYLWLRMAKPYAGETLGWHTPLIDGTEVAIAYSNGDIDLPYIACALHDSEHPDLVNATLLTGEKLGLFARTGQLSLKSGEGPVDIQAQNASMRLFAEKKLTLSSASDISFAGKKRITLIGGGSYLRLESGKVEYGTTASYMRKVKRTMAAGPSPLSLMPSFSQSGICLSCLLEAAESGAPIVIKGA